MRLHLSWACKPVSRSPEARCALRVSVPAGRDPPPADCLPPFPGRPGAGPARPLLATAARTRDPPRRLSVSLCLAVPTRTDPPRLLRWPAFLPAGLSVPSAYLTGCLLVYGGVTVGPGPCLCRHPPQVAPRPAGLEHLPALNDAHIYRSGLARPPDLQPLYPTCSYKSLLGSPPASQTSHLNSRCFQTCSAQSLPRSGEPQPSSCSVELALVTLFPTHQS